MRYLRHLIKLDLIILVFWTHQTYLEKPTKIFLTTICSIPFYLMIRTTLLW